MPATPHQTAAACQPARRVPQSACQSRAASSRAHDRHPDWQVDLARTAMLLRGDFKGVREEFERDPSESSPKLPRDWEAECRPLVPGFGIAAIGLSAVDLTV